MHLTADSRSGVHNQDIQVNCSNIAEALSWLGKLDGMTHTLMVLKRLDNFQLMVGGGPSWYIVTLDDGNHSLTLQNSDGVEAEIVELCAGGQYGEYPASFCVNQTQAGEIISKFFKGDEASATWA